MPQQPATPYDALGGAQVIEAIVTRFYALMDADPDYKELRALHAPDLSSVQHGLTLFLKAWTGGPKDWFERGQCVMSLHRKFPISAQVAEQWVEAMKRAIAEQRDVDGPLALAMAERLAHMARAMVNGSVNSGAAEAA